MVLFAGVSAKITVRGQVEILPGRQISLSKNLTKKISSGTVVFLSFFALPFFFVLGFCLDVLVCPGFSFCIFWPWIFLWASAGL